MMGDMPTSSSSTSGTMRQMTFTNDFKDTPVLFSGLKASSKAQAFGIFCLIIFIAIFLRGLMFLYGYLETEVWSKEKMAMNTIQKSTTMNFGFEDENDYSVEISSNISEKQGGEITEEKHHALSKASSNSLESNTHYVQHGNKIRLRSLFFTTWKEFEGDIIRLILSFFIALLAYSLMLITMTFVTCYFFAVVLGMALGEVWFRRWSFLISNKPSTSIGCNIPASFS